MCGLQCYVVSALLFPCGLIFAQIPAQNYVQYSDIIEDEPPTLNITEWNPLHSEDVTSLDMGRYAILILNRPINVMPSMMINLWKHAAVRVTVDAGTIRWYKFLEQLSEEGIFIEERHPDIITGDFDSIPEEVLGILKGEGCQVLRTSNQDETDFTKALMVLAEKDYNIHSVLAVSEHSGRIDQTMAALNDHYRARSIFMKRRVQLFQLAGDSLTWLLEPGRHYISIPERLRMNATWCSLLPIGEESLVSTSGLLYNLYAQSMQFGGIVSSSNTYNQTEEYVMVDTNGKLIWSMGLGLTVD